MSHAITPKDRREIADQVGLDEQYLYQCMTGRKCMRAETVLRVERQSGRRLRRWHLRPKDWHEQWPELVGSEGAPKVGEVIPALPA